MLCTRFASLVRLADRPSTARRFCSGLVAGFPKRHPVLFGMGCSLVKMSLGDLITQKAIEQRHEIDWRRNAFFGAFGVLYMGGVQYFVYVKAFSRLFPTAERFTAQPIVERLRDTRGMLEAVGQVAADVWLHIPFMYFPAFLLLKDLVLNPDGIRSKGTYQAQEILAQYRSEFFELNWATTKFFMPSGIIMFGLMPMHLRVPYVACIGLAWAAILSYMKGGHEAQEELVDVARRTQRGLPAQLRTMQGLGRSLGTLQDEYVTEDGFWQMLRAADFEDEATARRAFAALDGAFTMEHGRVHVVEVKVFLSMLTTRDLDPERVRLMFGFVDHDGSGALSREELQHMMRVVFTVRERMLAKSIGSMFTATAGIGPGIVESSVPETYMRSEAAQSDRLSALYSQNPGWKGLKLSLGECIEEMVKESVDDIFCFADCNRDGVISPDEFRDWLDSKDANARLVKKTFQKFQINE